MVGVGPLCRLDAERFAGVARAAQATGQLDAHRDAVGDVCPERLGEWDAAAGELT